MTSNFDRHFEKFQNQIREGKLEEIKMNLAAGRYSYADKARAAKFAIDEASLANAMITKDAWKLTGRYKKWKEPAIILAALTLLVTIFTGSYDRFFSKPSKSDTVVHSGIETNGQSGGVNNTGTMNGDVTVNNYYIDLNALVSKADSRGERSTYSGSEESYSEMVESPDISEQEKVAYLSREAWTLYAQGDEFGNETALKQSLVTLQKNLALNPKEKSPETWAEIQSNIAAVRLKLAERGLGVDFIRSSIEANNLALNVWSKENSPKNWANTQNTLGNAYSDLAKQTNVLEHFATAEKFYLAALEIRQREAMPFEWAQTKNGLGVVYKNWGEKLIWDVDGKKFPDEQRIREGVSKLNLGLQAYGEALQVMTIDNAPMDWALAKQNVGNILYAAGDLTGDVNALLLSINSGREALQVFTTEKRPVKWAEIQVNMGAALNALGYRTRDVQKLEESIRVTRMALEIRTLDKFPKQWAETQSNIAIALENLGTVTEKPEYFKESLDIMKQVYQVKVVDGDMTHENAGLQKWISELEDEYKRAMIQK